MYIYFMIKNAIPYISLALEYNYKIRQNLVSFKSPTKFHHQWNFLKTFKVFESWIWFFYIKMWQHIIFVFNSFMAIHWRIRQCCNFNAIETIMCISLFITQHINRQQKQKRFTTKNLDKTHLNWQWVMFWHGIILSFTPIIGIKRWNVKI